MLKRKMGYFFNCVETKVEMKPKLVGKQICATTKLSLKVNFGGIHDQ